MFMALRNYGIALFILRSFIIAARSRKNFLSPALASSGNGSASISITHPIVLTVGISLVVIVVLIIMLILLTKNANKREKPSDDRTGNAFWDSRSWGYLQAGHIFFNFDKLFHTKSQMLKKSPNANGSTYKAVLKTGNNVVVKRLNGVIRDKAFFEDHMNNVAADTYLHFVPLRGFFYNEQEKMIVYDYKLMGSLHALLHVRRTSLSWKTRWIIALGAARGVARIHKGDLVHGRIKSANIMLGPQYEICVSENGLSHMMAPAQTGPPSQISDVRDFGVVLLELLSRNGTENLRQLLNRDFVVGRLQNLTNNQRQADLHIDSFLDPELNGNKAARAQILNLLLLAIDCTDAGDLGLALSMGNVIGRIKNANPEILYIVNPVPPAAQVPPPAPVPPAAEVPPRRSSRLRGSAGSAARRSPRLRGSAGS